MKKLYLADVSHTTAQGLTSEFIPYAIGCLKSYFLTHGKARDHYEIRLFQDPYALIQACEAEMPDLLGCSNYSWNAEISYALAEQVKLRSPSTLVVFGGPNYPLDDEVRLRWLREHPAVDVYVIGEGEHPFTEVIDHWHAHHDIEQLKHAGIEGVHSLVNNALLKPSDVMPRLPSIDAFESPYVKGYLDEFLSNAKLVPLTETNRGCPFKCTFCEKGIDAWQKITKRGVERFEEEIRYIATHTDNAFMVMADNNFGMLKEDLAFAQALTRCYHDLGYPIQVHAATGKARHDRVIETINALEGRMPVTIAVQSMDEQVLQNSKRKNLPLDSMIEVSGARQASGASARSEVILGLPGDTKEKHIDSLCQLVDIGVNFVLAYTLILLDGSELGTLESRKKWGMQTKYRLNHRCFGNYQFGDQRIRVAEPEEVVVGLNTLTEDDYHDCRLFFLTIGIFHMDEVLHELAEFLKSQGIAISRFLKHIHAHARHHFDDRLKALYESYGKATRQELWPTREALVQYIQEQDRSEADIEEMGGYNVIFHHRAWSFTENIEAVIDAAFATSRELLGETVWQEHQAYLEELSIFMKLRKRNVFDCNQINRASFHYDFARASADKFTTLPQRLKTPCQIELSHSDEQKKLFASFNPGRNGAARALAKLQMLQMYRQPRGLPAAKTDLAQAHEMASHKTASASAQ